jgi:cytochrome d ubiquinol oxidase subunit I
MLSVSAWYLLKKRHLDLARSNFRLALPFFIVLTITNVTIFGAGMAIEVTHQQPIKLASMEGLWQGTTCAPLYVVGWVDVATQTTNGISIPCLLSVLAYFNPQAYVTGLNDFPGQPLPPIALLFQVYHLMFMLGSLFVPIGLLGGLFYVLRRGKKGDPDRPRRIWDARWVLRLFVVTVFLVEVAIIAGWWTAEIGRQPWVVYQVLLTADGVSPVLTAVEVVLSLGMFVILYGLLLALFLYLLNRKIQHGPEPLEEVETVEVSSLPDTFREVFRRRDRADAKEL